MVLIDGAARCGDAAAAWCGRTRSRTRPRSGASASPAGCSRCATTATRSAPRRPIAEGEAMLVMMLLDAPAEDAGRPPRPRRRRAGGAGGAVSQRRRASPTTSSRTCSSPTPPGSRRSPRATAAAAGAASTTAPRGRRRRPRRCSTPTARRPDRPSPTASCRPPGRVRTRCSPTPSAPGALRFWLSRGLPAERAATLAAALGRRPPAPDPRPRRRDCWALAWRLRCRSEAGRARLEAALQRHLPALAGPPLPGGRPPSELVWTGAGARSTCAPTGPERQSTARRASRSSATRPPVQGTATHLGPARTGGRRLCRPDD